ncbi:MAG: DUF2914 domain-containing protein [bacterium]|nr:DUF2914 domain-containing protein [bacterium]
MTSFFEKTKIFYQQYERYLSALALLTGFIVDNITLRNADLLLGNLVLFSYLIIAGGGIAFAQLYKSGRVSSRWFQNIAPLFPLLIQFSFGALFSGYFVFYSLSGSLTGSLLFLILILALLIGNEFFRTQYQKLVFQISVFYAALFSFVIFFIPILTSTMGVQVFLLSGGISLLLIAILIYGLFRITSIRATESKTALFKSIGGIFIFINILYFANIIPPIPLSLKDIGVYHNIKKGEGGGYLVYREKSQLKILEAWNTTIHRVPNERIYVYSSVFAPTDLNTQIFHRWQYFDEIKKKWIIQNDIPFPITGGRDEGYRGYSFKDGVFRGEWRVDVVTARGQIVGRVNFTIFAAEYPPVLFVEKK